MTRLRTLAATAGAAILCLTIAAPAWADLLYPADPDGNWGIGPAVCDGTEWSGTFHLGYVLVDPDVDWHYHVNLIPGETITVELAPAIIGSLRGSVVVEGTTTITGAIAPEAADQGRLLDDDSTFTLSLVPGPRTIGTRPVDGDDWEVVPVGIAALEGTITGSESGVQHVWVPVQPFVSCRQPPVTAGFPEDASTAGQTPAPTGEVLALPDTDTAPRAGSPRPPVSVAFALFAATPVLLAVALALRRTTRAT